MKQSVKTSFDVRKQLSDLLTDICDCRSKVKGSEHVVQAYDNALRRKASAMEHRDELLKIVPDPASPS